MDHHGFDALDVRILRALEIDGRASFNQIGAVLGVSDQTVARRYRGLRAEAGLRVVAVRDSERLGQDEWVLRMRCAPDNADTIADALAKRRDTAWILLASGGTEVTTMTRPRTRGEHDELLLGKLPRTPSVMEIRAYQMLHRFFGGPEGWLGKFGALTDAEATALWPEPPPSNRPARIDPEDEPLVNVLERDGRATYAELQKATGRSESAVKRRLTALRASGALFLDIDYPCARLGYPVSAILWITAAPARLTDVGEALAGHQEIAFAAAIAGPCNLMATAVAPDTASLYAYLSGPLGSLEGVQHVETTPILRLIKQLAYQARRG